MPTTMNNLDQFFYLTVSPKDLRVGKNFTAADLSVDRIVAVLCAPIKMKHTDCHKNGAGDSSYRGIYTILSELKFYKLKNVDCFQHS